MARRPSNSDAGTDSSGLARCRRLAALAAMMSLALSISRADDMKPAPAGAPAKYLLRYKFEPGRSLRWNVTHRVRVNTTVSGTTQTAETTSISVKVWKILPADDKGNFRFEHSVQKVEMRQQLSGREGIAYNSETDRVPPIGFEDAAKNVGVPLAVITIDPRGNVIAREQKRPSGSDNHSQIVIPLPEEEVPIGHTWAFPYDVPVPLHGEVRQIKTRQHFELESVEDGIATIAVDTQVLTPVHDPEIEAQLIQRETKGKVKFDLNAGCIIAQEMDLDKSVIGFSGDSSSLHYVMRFNEELLPAEAVAGPAPAPVARSAANPPRKKPAPRPGRPNYRK